MEEILAEVIGEVVEAVADSAIKDIKNKREAKKIKNEANSENDFYKKKIKKKKHMSLSTRIMRRQAIRRAEGK